MFASHVRVEGVVRVFFGFRFLFLFQKERFLSAGTFVWRARRSRTRAELWGLPRPLGQEARGVVHGPSGRRAPFSVGCGPGLPTGARPGELGKVLADFVFSPTHPEKHLVLFNKNYQRRSVSRCRSQLYVSRLQI